jgi:hypothetical protein
LRGSRALVGRRHFLKVVVVYPKQKSARNEKCCQATHRLIVFQATAGCKIIASVRIEEGNNRTFPRG